MVKMKLNDIRMLIIPLRKLSSQEFPVKYSWKILQLCEKIEAIVNKIEEFRVSLVDKYGDNFYVCTDIENDKEVIFSEDEYNNGLDETKYVFIGQRREVKDQEKCTKFYVEFNELLAIEEEILDEKIDISSIADKVNVSAQELYSLQNVFIFE